MGILLKKFKNAEDSNNISRMNAEEIADVLYCLCNAASEEKLKNATPENVEILENGEVRILSAEEQDLYYAAPEEILGISKANKSTGWFTLGLLVYFVINGRSYYSDKSINLVNIKELQNRYNSMIMAEGIDQSTEDIPELFTIAIEKFTSWDATKRPEGVKFLLKAIQQFASTADVQYMCNGRQVLSNTISISPPKLNIPKNTDIEGSDGKKYRVLNDIGIPFRPGSHKIVIEVCEEDASQYDYFLFIQVSSQNRLNKLMKLEREEQIKKIEVNTNFEKTYLFYVCIGDPVSKREVGRQFKRSIRIPAMPDSGTSLLQVKYNPETGVEIALYNRAGTQMISDNVIRFSVK